jgi:uncharacterized membrane protein YphA (DoxX/SURF4 family)
VKYAQPHAYKTKNTLLKASGSFAFLPLRTGVGVVMAAHGAQKLFGWVEIPNEETEKALEDSRAGRNPERFESADALIDSWK